MAGLVGPFSSPELANKHVAYCEARGDADPGRVVDEGEARHLMQFRGIDFVTTPEDDRALFDRMERMHRYATYGGYTGPVVFVVTVVVATWLCVYWFVGGRG